MPILQVPHKPLPSVELQFFEKTKRSDYSTPVFPHNTQHDGCYSTPNIVFSDMNKRNSRKPSNSKSGTSCEKENCVTRCKIVKETEVYSKILCSMQCRLGTIQLVMHSLHEGPLQAIAYIHALFE